MAAWLMIGGAVLALAVGIWIGVGAPGWPQSPDSGRRHRLEKRDINPIAWGRSSSRERVGPRSRSERRIRLR